MIATLAAGGGGGDGGAAMRLLLGLAVLVALALIAAHRRWWAWRRAPLGAALTTGGYLTMAIGLLLGPHAIGLIDAADVSALRPLILFCLGWVGLMVGLQLRRDLPSLLPARTLPLAGLDALLSILGVGGAAFCAMAFNPFTAGLRVAEVGVIAGVLGACAIGWSAELRSLVGSEQHRGAAGRVRAVAGLTSAVAIAAYGVVFMLIEHGATFGISLLPLGVGLIVSLLTAGIVGLLGAWLMPLARKSESSFLVVLLGLVAFAAGAAATLGYSPLLVAMLAGALVVNLPGSALTRLRRVVVDAEQPVAMALMLTAGVIADPRLGAGLWLAIGVILAARLLAKWPLGLATTRDADQPASSGPLPFAAMRQAPLAVALAVGYAISGHARVTETVIDGGKLVMLVILIGLGSDIVPQLLRLIAPNRPASGEATGPATETHTDRASDTAPHAPAAGVNQSETDEP